MELELAIRRRVTAVMVRKYRKATKAEKSAILDQLCELTGWHRDHARKALRAALRAAGQGQPRPAAPPPRRPREPVYVYGPEVIEALRMVWAVLDGEQNQITFTRSRPNNSNDGCHVEQKNWAVARRTAGYWRYETPRELALLNQIWTTLAPLTNLFTPQQRLISKTRIGAKVIKRYDTAKTPYQRLLAHPDALDEIDAKLLAKRYQTINPAQVRREVTDLQRSLLAMVAHKNTTRRGKQNAVYLSRAKLDESTTSRTRPS